MLTTTQLVEAQRAVRTLARVFRHKAPSLELDDMTQEALLRLWTMRDRFDNRVSVSTWASRVAANVFKNMVRKLSNRHAAYKTLGAVSRRHDDITPEEIYIAAQAARLYQAELTKPGNRQYRRRVAGQRVRAVLS